MNERGLLTVVGVRTVGLGDRVAGSWRLATCTRVPGISVHVYTCYTSQTYCVIPDCYVVYQVPGTR